MSSYLLKPPSCLIDLLPKKWHYLGSKMVAIVPVSKQEIMKKVPDISVKTVELVLSKMLKEKKIKK